MPNSSDKLNSALARACVTLGLTPPFSVEQVKTRYRELAKIYHPDVGTNKDNNRFAEITQAYELATEHFPQISQQQITLVKGLTGAPSQVADILEQLRQARTKTLEANNKLKNLEAETTALRAHLEENRTFTLKRIIGITLLIITGITLGFLAGMLWSSPPPFINLAPIPARHVTTETTSTLFTAHLDGLGYDAHVHLNGPTVATLTYESGTVSLGSSGASLNSTPTITIHQFPEISVAPVPQIDLQTAPPSMFEPATQMDPASDQQPQQVQPGAIPSANTPEPDPMPDTPTTAPAAPGETNAPPDI